MINHFGQYLQTAGPDFFNAIISIDNQTWAGNIEMHVNSSDWYVHQHQQDKNYHNVILHVVWQHDVEVYDQNNQAISTLEIKNFVLPNVLERYQNLMQQKQWILCENSLPNVPKIYVDKWLETLFFERLQQKSIHMATNLAESKNHWEYCMFVALAKNFGLNTNGLVFEEMAKIITFEIVNKESHDLRNLEALFFGVCGLLNRDFEDTYPKLLQTNYNYLTKKYPKLSQTNHQPEFFKLRPDNFPTIRLAQLAMVYHLHKNLFQKLLEAIKNKTAFSFLKVKTSDYWATHYNFDKPSAKKNKLVSQDIIHLITINTIFPLYHLYQTHNQITNDDWLEYIYNIPAENNTIVQKFNALGIQAKNALESQALIALKKQYCDHKKCMKCAIGQNLLKEVKN